MKSLCTQKMNFQECELAILRHSIDLAQEKIGKRVVSSPEIQEIITIVENFLKKKTLICYGGTAINNILPKDDQFYDREAEIPDYDFFSANALDDAKELADIYFKKGYTEVEAKAGQHHGTFKVFVNYVPIADITNLPKGLFQALKKEAIRVSGIMYCPPNFLRMSMYLELSRPAGDTGRWEKILKRLTLLNKHYPLSQKQCSTVDFQRKMEDQANENLIYDTVKNVLINQGVVFFGGYAISMYRQYMPKAQQKQLEKTPDFDVLSNDPKVTAEITRERLLDIGMKNVKIKKHEALGDVIPVSYEIIVGNDTIAFIYHPIGCHSFNSINIGGKKVKIASIDTMLSFYLAFLYADRPYLIADRIICMSEFLFNVQQKNRLEQKGLLRRFSITCYGHQETVEEMRAEKVKKFNELKNKRGTREYDEYFLMYRPSGSESGTKSVPVKPAYKQRPRVTTARNIYARKHNKTKRKWW